MVDVPLLNPSATDRDTAACREQIAVVGKHLADCEKTLTHSVLDRETYLQTIGGAYALRRAQEEMQITYRKRFPS